MFQIILRMLPDTLPLLFGNIKPMLYAVFRVKRGGGSIRLRTLPVLVNAWIMSLQHYHHGFGVFTVVLAAKHGYNSIIF